MNQYSLKRERDELSASAPVHNGSFGEESAADHPSNNDAKKARLEGNNQVKPSRVVHIRNIPVDVTEAEIIQLGIPFGKVTNVLVLKGKNQAFLEMADETVASTMVKYFTGCTAQLRGWPVYIQFSSHKELITDQTHSNANPSAQAALQAAQALVQQTDTKGGPNTVLRVIVEHMIFPVTLDVLHQIFSRVAKVLKIVTFTRNNTLQALIQYPDVVMAQAAKMTFDGQNIYNDCCTLRIEYSRLSDLNVKYNNDKSRDYTKHDLPSGDVDSSLPIGGFSLGGMKPNTSSSFDQMSHRVAGQSIGEDQFGLSSILLVSNLNEEMVTPDALFTLFGVYGDVHRVKIIFNKKDNALIQMSDYHQAKLAISNLDRVTLWGKQINVTLSKHKVVQMPKEGQPNAGLNKDYSNSPLHRFKKPGSKNFNNIYPPSSTLHLSNIPSSSDEDHIKDAFTKQGISIRNFRFFVAKLKSDDKSNSSKTRSDAEKVKADLSERDKGQEHTCKREKKMALIQMESVEDAILALIKMHNYQLADSTHLRVSFSKSTI